MARKKNPHAVALGKRGAKVRMRKLTPEQRQAIARNAVMSRWARRGAKGKSNPSTPPRQKPL